MSLGDAHINRLLVGHRFYYGKTSLDPFIKGKTLRNTSNHLQMSGYKTKVLCLDQKVEDTGACHNIFIKWLRVI
jgi:hypothetical protein